MCSGKILKCSFLWLEWGRYERGVKEGFWQTPPEAIRSFCPRSLSCSLLLCSPSIDLCCTMWWHRVQSNMQDCCTACASHFLTRNTLKFCQAGPRRRSVKLKLLSGSESSGRPSYSNPPSPLLGSIIRPFPSPFRIWTIETFPHT